MIWKNIKNFSNYEISEFGNVRNKKTHKILKPYLGLRGYYTVGIKSDLEIKPTPKAIHTLVAVAFLDFEPQGCKLVVNHIDGNKLNNHYTNLETITARENCLHAINTGLNPLYKIVYQYDSIGNLLNKFNSVKEAAEKTKIDHRFIAACANNNFEHHKTANGFVWSYSLLSKEEVLNKFIKHTTGKKVLCVETGIIYDTFSEAALATKAQVSKISLVCKGKRNTAGGYHWKLV